MQVKLLLISSSTIWNDLPPHIKSTHSLLTFKSLVSQVSKC